VTSRRLVRSAALGVLAGYVLLASSSDVFAASMAHQASSPIVKGACATRPKAAILEDTAFTPTAAPSSPSGSPSGSGSASAPVSATPSGSTTPATPTKSVTPTPQPSNTHSVTTSPTDKPTSTPTLSPTTSPSASTSPSKSPSPTKSPTKSPSPTPSSSAPATPQLCVSVQSLVASSQVRPGHNASFVIWVWSTKGTSKGVKVALRVAQVRHVKAPHFTVCPSATGASCAIGTLPAGQADELRGAAFVQKAAKAGEQVQLTATASGTSAKSNDADGSVVVTAAPSPTPTASSSTPAPTSGVTLPPAAVPPVSSVGAGLGNPANLFPTISPSPSTSSPATGGSLGFPKPRKQAVRIATSSAIVPLNSRLIGGQLAGLAVLAGAIAIAIARLSLRKPRTQSGPDSSKTDT
jgi:hypothetical protein